MANNNKRNGSNQRKSKGNGYNKNSRRPNRKERLEESLVMRNNKSTFDSDERRLMNGDNDPSWYASNPQLITDYASYPFGNPLGNTIGNLNGYYTTPIPGVAAYYYVPCVGVATKETDPINVAMRKMYSFVRYANSGAKNYDAPDLMLYFVAVDSARMYLSWMKRIYGVLFNYTAFNRYYPTTIVTAMNGNFLDLQSKLADFRGYINQFAVRLNQLWVPAGLSYTKRHEWMTSHIYVDSADSTKAQTYFYSPAAFYKFTLSGDPIVGSCTLVYLNKSMTLDNIINFGNSLLEPLITNEDIGIMSGDILKAYGQAGVEHTLGISEDYKVLPEYSQEVASQFENLVMLPNISCNITQNTAVGGGFLISTPKGRQNTYNTSSSADIPQQYKQNIADAMAGPVVGAKILNFHHENVRPEEVLVATRCMPTIGNITFGTSPSSISFDFNVTSCGSEIVVGMLIYNTPSATPTREYITTAKWSSLVGRTVDQTATVVSSAMDDILLLANFDWHPNVVTNFFVGADSSDIAWTKSSVPFLDADNYTILDDNNLANMHMTALLSEFTVPMIN